MTSTYPSGSISPVTSQVSLSLLASIWRASERTAQSAARGRHDVVERWSRAEGKRLEGPL